MPAPPPESDPAIVSATCMAGNLHTLLRDLQRRKARERRGLVVVEGRRLVEDALAGGAKVVAVLAADDAGAQAAGVLEEAARRRVPCEVAPRREFDELADTETPSGVLAVVEWRPLALEAVRLEARATVLVLDAVQDPGNVGTMIRTAYALGAAATVALEGTADVRSPKVLRAAMGAAFRHQVAETRWEMFASFAAANAVEIWAATQDGNVPPPAGGALAPGGRLALIVGNEGAGLRDGVLSAAARRVGVPMRPGAESLNAAVAAGILLHELVRASR
jgi:TrmH family RNA methyltransferase